MLQEESTSISTTEVLPYHDSQNNNEDTSTNYKIYIRDPIKVTGVVPHYVIYKVCSNLTGIEQKVVERRYRDFEWLHLKLHEEFPECIIPPLPPKQLIGRFEETFIESRRRALDKFMDRISAHKKLRQSHHFQHVFLQADEKQFSLIKSKVSNTKELKGNWIARGVSGFVKTTSRAIVTAAMDGLSNPNTSNNQHTSSTSDKPKLLLFSQDRDIFDEKAEESNHMQYALNDVGPLNSQVSIRSCEISVAQARLGQAITAYALAEEDSDMRSFCMEYGSMLIHLSAHSASHAQSDYDYFESPLLEIAGFAESIHNAFMNRKKEKEEYLDECSTIVVKSASIERTAQINGSIDSSLEGRQSQIGMETKELLAKKKNLLKKSDELLAEYNYLKDQLSEETTEIFSQFLNRKIEHCIKAKSNIGDFVNKYDPKRKAKK